MFPLSIFAHDGQIKVSSTTTIHTRRPVHNHKEIPLFLLQLQSENAIASCFVYMCLLQNSVACQYSIKPEQYRVPSQALKRNHKILLFSIFTKAFCKKILLLDKVIALVSKCVTGSLQLLFHQ